MIQFFDRKFDTLNLENQLEKNDIIVTKQDNEKVEKEKEAEEKRTAFSLKKESNELLINTSGESSTDTLIPNNDLTIIGTTNGEKDM